MIKLKFNINISNKTTYTLIAIILLLIIGGFVYAYGDFSTGVPSTLGHTSDEMMVNIEGTQKTLQQAIDDGDFQGQGYYSGHMCGGFNLDGLSGTTCQTGSPYGCALASCGCPQGVTAKYSGFSEIPQQRFYLCVVD